MILTIAWRNLWRNKRRTLITTASVFFAVLIAILMRSFQLGYYNNALNSIIEHFTGHIQIQQKDYYLNPNLDNVLKYDKELTSILENDPDIKQYIPRLQAGVMLSSGNQTKVGMVVGVDVNKEVDYSDLNAKVAKYKIDPAAIERLRGKLPGKLLEYLETKLQGYYNSKESMLKKMKYFDKDFKDYIDVIAAESGFPGRYLKPGENGILIGSKLADFLGVTVGDSIIILGQGYHGITAVGKYPIVGILNFPNPQFNETMVYMPLSTAQELFSVYDITDKGDTVRYVSYVTVNTVYQATIQPVDYMFIKRVRDRLQKELAGRDVRVLGWQELNKELIQQIQSDNAGGLIMLIVLFIIIGMGVFGTVLMMTMERRKEFGIQIAIGMRRNKLIKVVSLEILIMTLLGVVSAVIVSVPIILYGHYHPIYLASPEIEQAFAMFNMEPVMPMDLFGPYMITQPLIVMFIVMLTTVYPVITIRKMKVSDALRS